MQILVRNRFVERSTAGTTEAAGLGLLTVTMLAPDTSVFGKMLVAAAFVLAGTAIFLRILRQVPLRDVLLVPLIGIMLGGVISAVTAFFAYRFDLIQSMLAWTTGDFSGVLRGRYELLWVGFLFAVMAYLAADRFIVAGMGRDFTADLGLNYRRVMALGLTVISLVSTVVVVAVGMTPFLGLIVPNVVNLTVGYNMRRSVPRVAVLGATFILLCDILGRTVRAAYEIPIGSALFLYLLLWNRHHA